MKYYKVKVKREAKVGGGTHYVYPEGFKDLKFFNISYESGGEPEKVEARPDMNHEYVVIEAPDNEKVEIADCEEVAKNEGKELKKKWVPKEVTESTL